MAAKRRHDSKYQRFLEGLPKYAVEEHPGRAALIKDVRAKLTERFGESPSVAVLSRKYIEARNEVDRIDEQAKVAGIILDAVQEMMLEQFDAEGVDSMRTKEGMISVYIEPYASVEDHAKLRQWAIDNNLGDALQIGWQKINSLTKQLLEEGQPAPDGTKVFQKTKIRLERTKARKEGDDPPI